ncbi:glucans biosynthesis glucosyltransferase MdoH [Salinisphaera sp. Q1T1-3]|uniref:glucans biosynthesis glucosyltransferase MdoH n=1 Tax=Salinisphaera sp. Q1T1-3 TaxID=2321229 RepID=UPI000E710B3C|nr:glucans biosynthesis glucosyltransferase MdoH [Salinisphaera sp. Q1T1-3]RJS93338.1 glucans biosynthesis glucosyltransferase MdoH [Salinisphaera sp. Q1T1-3]
MTPNQDSPMGRVEIYLDALSADETRRQALRETVAATEPATVEAAMAALLDALEDAGRQASPQEAELAERIALAYPGLVDRAHAVGGGGYRGASMPRLNRWSMSPAAMDRRPWRFLSRLMPGVERRLRLPKAVPSRLRGIVRLRQIILFFLVALPAAGATFYMLTVLPHQGRVPIEVVILALAGLLFAWILTGFWTAMAGFFVLWRGDKHLISAGPARTGDIEPNVRTAIVMPIYEEDVTRTFAGLQAIIESLKATGRLDEFDVFVLSDSVKPDTIAAEQATWAETCRRLGAFDRLFYRRRRARVKRKSGNLADFCRRWGGHYRYMIVLDADSIMVGSTLTAMVDRMQANPNVGLIQTPPTAVNRSSFLARVQQFATRVYGRMFAAGLHYWHLDNAHYWGHNAIIRIAPFMAHCGLPRLPGRGALSGEILSHDFVEAALMRRAGWGVFIAYDLPGSYEEVPPSLIDELGRDRRWCQGNIQHLRLLFSDNLAPAHRALFANGVMAYTSAAIWFVFLVLSSTEAVFEAIRTPDYFPSPGALFPSWPVWQPIWAVSLFCATLVVLFLPKIVGVAMIIARGRQKEFGGVGNLIGSTLIEIILTSLLAPIRMLAHTVFVATTLIGKQVKWNNQQRADATVPWLAALRFHLPGMVLAVAWGAVLYIYTPGFFPWLLPILVPLFFAPIVTVITSRTDIGVWMRRKGLQLIPEESVAPRELTRVIELEDGAQREAGLIDIIVDPRLNALHLGLQGSPRHLSEDLSAQRAALAEKALAEGPTALAEREQRELLADPERLAWLHRQIWQADTMPDWARSALAD